MRQGLTAGAAGAAAAVLFLMSAADATQPRLRDVERRRTEADAERRRLEADSRAAGARIDALSGKLAAAAAERRAAKADVVRLERDTGQLLAGERAAQAAANRTAAQLELTLIALSTPGVSPVRTAVAGAAGEALVRRNGQARVVAEGLRAERTDLAARRAELAVAEARLDSADAAMRVLIAEQRTRRDALDAGASRAKARATALAEQARTLRELVARTTRRAPARTTPAAVTRTPATTPASALRAAARLSPDARVVRRFGEAQAHGRAQGLSMTAPAGAQVLAPAAGKVVWAGPFRSYGRVLIIDPGADCAIVLAGMGEILVREGQMVQTGRPIAEMALDATAAPELYVEVRRGGNPVDPVPWLNGAR